jgi:hypothetical protein
MQSISKNVALVSLLLTVLSAAALTAHHHSSATEAARCSVCVTAHSALPKAATTAPETAFVSAFIQVPEPVSAQQRLVSFALRVRPPPGV